MANPNECDLSADVAYALSCDILWCAVCVPRSWDNARIEDWVNAENPAGTTNGWRVGEDEADRCDCPDDPNRIHIRLWC